ncbi:MAG: hypothetical protein AB8B97_24365 [Granulosicoccus sp.]
MGQVSEHTDPRLLANRDALVEQILLAYKSLSPARRLVVGIAGAPASGKSTLAEWLVTRLNSKLSDTQAAVVVPMDGFHLDNAILDARGNRSVKGAPHTFDAVGFQHLLQRLSSPVPDSAEASVGVVYIPVFDRTMDLARCAASEVTSHHRIVVVEGNYLLLNRPVWRELRVCLDISVMLDVPLETLEKRLVKRWIDHGLDGADATDRALSNDIPNARVVTLESSSAHFLLKGVRQ